MRYVAKMLPALLLWRGYLSAQKQYLMAAPHGVNQTDHRLIWARTGTRKFVRHSGVPKRVIRRSLIVLLHCSGRGSAATRANPVLRKR